jgi:hypothetical protein
MSASHSPDASPLHFGDLDADPPATACGVPFLEAGRVEYRRGAFLRSENACVTCVAIARALCPEVDA